MPKVKAYSLSFSLIVLLIASVFYSVSLIHEQYRKSLLRRIENLILLQNDLQIGIQSILENEHFAKGKHKIKLEEKGLHLSLFTKPWGMYQLCLTRSMRGLDSARSSFISGFLLPTELKNTALYLLNSTLPLGVTGNTTLFGDAFVPSGIIKKSIVNGRGFEKSKLIHGHTLTSEDSLPHLISKFKIPKRLLHTTLRKDSLEVSFFDPPMLINVYRKRELNRKTISGHVIIKSRDSIIVNDSYLTDVILVAPFVKLGKGTTGCLQVYSKEVVIDNGVELSYPSVLYTDAEFASIQLKPDSKFSGTIINQSDISYLKLCQGSELSGLIYSNGHLELRGRVFGGVFCKRLIHHESGSIHYNLLSDCEINVLGRHSGYAFPELFSNHTKTIMKWLER